MSHFRNRTRNARRYTTGHPSRPRGAVMVVALVALAVVATLLVVWTRAALRDHLRRRTDFRGLQADWLAESGVERAMAQLRRRTDYTGEVWRVPADQLGGQDEAVVTIRVESTDASGERTVTVQADYPPDAAERQRRTKQIMVQVPSSNAKPPTGESS